MGARCACALVTRLCCCWPNPPRTPKRRYWPALRGHTTSAGRSRLDYPDGRARAHPREMQCGQLLPSASIAGDGFVSNCTPGPQRGSSQSARTSSRLASSWQACGQGRWAGAGCGLFGRLSAAAYGCRPSELQMTTQQAKIIKPAELSRPLRKQRAPLESPRPRPASQSTSSSGAGPNLGSSAAGGRN